MICLIVSSGDRVAPNVVLPQACAAVASQVLAQAPLASIE